MQLSIFQATRTIFGRPPIPSNDFIHNTKPLSLRSVTESTLGGGVQNYGGHRRGHQRLRWPLGENGISSQAAVPMDQAAL